MRKSKKKANNSIHIAKNAANEKLFLIKKFWENEKSSKNVEFFRISKKKLANSRKYSIISLICRA